MANSLLLSFTLRSRQLIEIPLHSKVNSRVDLKLLESFKVVKIFFTMSPYKNRSSINLTHSSGLNLWVCEPSVFTSSIEIHAYGGTNFVPVAVPDIC